MNEDTARKWILKAESDLKIAKDEFTMENPATDAICFHAQQCAENTLKHILYITTKKLKKLMT